MGMIVFGGALIIVALIGLTGELWIRWRDAELRAEVASHALVRAREAAVSAADEARRTRAEVEALEADILRGLILPGLK